MTDLSGGLSPDHELFFPERPDDPEMRESTSVWLFDEAGRFALPRIGIEAEAHSWEDRSYQTNVALGGGRILIDTARGPIPSPFGPDGRPSVIGAGPLIFRMIEPFRRWQLSYDGTPLEGTAAEQIAAKPLTGNAHVPLSFEAELTMATPGWVQDNTPEKVALMTPEQRDDATSMGLGWRIEHLFRATGRITVDGATRDFTAVGSRIKRQSVRPLAQFRGHCWQSALFPDGRAFGYIAYPPREDGSDTYNDGYVYEDGRMFPARATRIPWLRRLVPEGDDVTLELEYERGTVRIAGSTAFSTFRVHNPEMADGRFTLQQSGARYAWDGQAAYGMIERSSVDAMLAG